MLSPQDLCGTLADDDAGSHRVTGRHARHDRPVRNAKVVDAIDFQTAIYNGHGVSSHLGCAGLMPVALDSIADEVFELCTFQGAWHHLALGERPERDGVANLAAQLNADYGSFQIVWM